MKLSIIIPVYNGEKYLKECLDSVMTCNIKEMECILINDGSTDASLCVCHSYERADKRFIVIDQENGGVSKARNAGIRKACGNYILFLDSDDYMDENAWELLDKSMEEEYDLEAFSYYLLEMSEKEKMKFPPEKELICQVEFPFKEKTCCDFTMARNYVLASSLLNTCWGKLFLTRKLKENNILFPDKVRIGEDFIFVLEYFKKCNSVRLHNAPILYYRQHSISAMRTCDLEGRLNYTDLLFSYNKAAVAPYKEAELTKAFYLYYFRVITNLFLEFTKSYSFFALAKELQKVLKRESIEEILGRVELSCLPSYKKVEGILLKNKMSYLLALYFKIKINFRH